MNSKDANPQNFTMHSIVFNNKHFSIALGKWKNETKYCLGMRWTGKQNDPNDKGYPKVFGNPMWFIVDKSMTKLILKGLVGKPDSIKDKLLEAINIVF